MKELMAKIEAKKAEIKAKQKEIDNFEIDPDDYAEQYDDILNEEGDVKVAGLTFSPAQIVKELDPTAYRCGLNDYVDSIDKNDIEGFQDLEDELEALENELTDLENELEEKEEGLKMKKTIVVIGGNCGGEGNKFVAWLKKNHPELEIDYQPHSTGVGGGVFDDNGDEIDGLSNELWTDYCNS